VFFQRKETKAKIFVCLGYQYETLKQHDLETKQHFFLRHITRERKVPRVRVLRKTPSERERQRQRNDDDDTNNNNFLLLFAFFEKDVVVKKELFVVFVF